MKKKKKKSKRFHKMQIKDNQRLKQLRKEIPPRSRLRKSLKLLDLNKKPKIHPKRVRILRFLTKRYQLPNLRNLRLN